MKLFLCILLFVGAASADLIKHKELKLKAPQISAGGLGEIPAGEVVVLVDIVVEGQTKTYKFVAKRNPLMMFWKVAMFKQDLDEEWIEKNLE